MSEESQEHEANYFAMCLLMPEPLLRAEVAKIKHFDICNEKHMKKLADIFQVSVAMMAMRIGQLQQEDGKRVGA